MPSLAPFKLESVFCRLLITDCTARERLLEEFSGNDRKRNCESVKLWL